MITCSYLRAQGVTLRGPASPCLSFPTVGPGQDVNSLHQHWGKLPPCARLMAPAAGTGDRPRRKLSWVGEAVEMVGPVRMGVEWDEMCSVQWQRKLFSASVGKRRSLSWAGTQRHRRLVGGLAEGQHVRDPMCVHMVMSAQCSNTAVVKMMFSHNCGNP